MFFSRSRDIIWTRITCTINFVGRKMMHSESATLEPTLVPVNTSDPKPVKKADRQFDFKL